MVDLLSLWRKKWFDPTGYLKWRQNKGIMMADTDWLGIMMEDTDWLGIMMEDTDWLGIMMADTDWLGLDNIMAKTER